MKLLVTDNLISNLNQLDILDVSLEKISIKDVPNQAQSLFENDKFKFVFDEFVTITSFNKLNINLEDNYIFQIKKSNLSKFTSLGADIDVLHLDIEKKETFYPWDLTNIIYSSRKSIDLNFSPIFSNIASILFVLVTSHSTTNAEFNSSDRGRTLFLIASP